MPGVATCCDATCCAQGAHSASGFTQCCLAAAAARGRGGPDCPARTACKNHNVQRQQHHGLERKRFTLQLGKALRSCTACNGSGLDFPNMRRPPFHRHLKTSCIGFQIEKHAPAANNGADTALLHALHPSALKQQEQPSWLFRHWTHHLKTLTRSSACACCRAATWTPAHRHPSCRIPDKRSTFQLSI